MSESAYRARAAQYAPMKAALARILPQPLPEPMWGSLRRGVLRGLQEYAMVQEGDRLLVGLSGGKDSLTLLIALLLLQEHSPIRYEVGACTGELRGVACPVALTAAHPPPPPAATSLSRLACS